MSTLKAARADNFYFPPDEDYRTQKKRMRKTQKKPKTFGVPEKYGFFRGNKEDYPEDDIWAKKPRGSVIRFEMPFKVICLNCNAYIAKGVRFDAEKKCVGKYYSTDIYAFRMSCFKCYTRIVIQTDPENTDYICKEGVRKKIEHKDPNDPEVITVGHDLAERQMRATNALFILEQQAEESLKKSEFQKSRIGEEVQIYKDLVETSVNRDQLDKFVNKEQLEQDEILDDKKHITFLEDLSEARNKDSYLANSALRRRFREEKKKRESNKKENFTLPLLDVEQTDIDESKNITFISQTKKLRSHFKRMVKNKADIFSKGSVKTSSTMSVPNSLEGKKKRLQLIKFIESKANKKHI